MTFSDIAADLILNCKNTFSVISYSKLGASDMSNLELGPRCLKITEIVSFNIASEASYVYILSGQKFIKNAKNAQFGEFLKI